MEYYFYVILIFAIVLKLTVYLCWYQVKRSSATREVRIIMPDGTTRCAVISARGWVNQSPRSEERQNLPQAESLAAHDNQGMVECPVQPRYGDALNPQGQLTGPPEYSSQEWKLPKYEEVTGMPPPYTMAEPEATSAVQPVDSIHPVQAQISGPPPAYPGNPSFPASAYSEPSLNESPSFPPQPPTASPVDLATLSSGPHITVPQSTIPSTGHQMLDVEYLREISPGTEFGDIKTLPGITSYSKLRLSQHPWDPENCDNLHGGRLYWKGVDPCMTAVAHNAGLGHVLTVECYINTDVPITECGETPK